MAAPPPDARSLESELVSLRPVGSDAIVLRLRLPGSVPLLRAGRFFMLRRPDRLSPPIPRPFSLYRQEGSELEFLIKVIGPGTRALAATPPGQPLTVIGPLGRGWPTLDDASPWVAVAGGIGSAPFYEGIRQSLAGMDGAAPVSPRSWTLIYGGREEGMLYDLECFEELGVRVLPATDDGSRGFHGNAIDCLRAEWGAGRLPLRPRLLGCGPEPMMIALAALARDQDLECHLSLETYMGCGVGICNGCAVPTTPEGPLGAWPVAKCCTDGPVFPADAIRLEP